MGAKWEISRPIRHSWSSSISLAIFSLKFTFNSSKSTWGMTPRTRAPRNSSTSSTAPMEVSKVSMTKAKTTPRMMPMSKPRRRRGSGLRRVDGVGGFERRLDDLNLFELLGILDQGFLILFFQQGVDFPVDAHLPFQAGQLQAFCGQGVELIVQIWRSAFSSA